MDEQNKNLLLATSLSFLVLLGWMLLFPPEPIEQEKLETTTEQQSADEQDSTGLSTPVQVEQKETTEVSSVTENIPRIPIETDRVSGSLSLKGGRIDNLKLLDYFETQDEGSKNIELFQKDKNDYYAVYGLSLIHI